MRRFITFFITSIAMLASMAAGAQTRVACVGNSITYGYLLPDRDVNAYPFQLQRLLGPDYLVGNFGNSGATLLDHGHKPYVKLPEYKAAHDFNPDIVVIHLGINDTDPRNWPNYSEEFITDYVRMIESFRPARIIIAELTPLRATHPRFRTGTRDWRLEIIDAIRQVAEATGAELIDFDSPLRDRQNLIFDGIHPNAEGAGIMAEVVRGAITGQYGGLALPQVWQSGMVVQRNRPLTIRGRANAGAPIALTLDGRTYRTTTDNRGDWSITTAPLVTGPTYELTVTDGHRTITLTDILAGEVWLASGQSNMEFPLGHQPQADPELRVFDMKPIARTDNVLWPDSILDAMDRLGHYKATTWGQPDASFSAVAWHFARQLRDSLQVPVGVISNAVGGSPTEAWIDVNTLEANIPEILVNWRSNDYLQKWCQQRIGQNIGDRKDGRHPYEPSYLFACGIRPLKGFPIAGTIWYQGESNAHNVELHEQLFPLLAKSLRQEFGAQMPLYFVQLSSLNRPSWPHFRDSQRRLAQTVPYTGMAVTSDVGDSLDVHPRQKAPVGNRLARLALHRSYGHDVEDCGPTVESVVSAPGQVIITLSHAAGLTTSDGDAPRTFEMAGSNGIYLPASAQIHNNKIILTNMDIESPRHVRYAWQPFTRANVVNAEGLPMSTFRSDVDNAADFVIEPGYEVGVSAPFYGVIGGRLILAGGCNFPGIEPLAADAEKRFYSGIYAANPATMQWQRIGTLPQAMAHGASATTPQGLVWIAPDGRTWLYNGSLTELPDAPARIDNAACAAIGNVVYIAGGNVEGKPSRHLYALNIDTQKWTKLRDMPGNARVQPAMAASGGKLYVWSGFAGKHHGKDATINTDGLCYDPTTGKWSALPAPTGDVALAGGCAATLADGRIVLCGGVNKDVFLAALQNQAPDYLMHPIEWYGFNGKVFVYNPADGTFKVADDTADAARAGAAIFQVADKVYLYGGELKPRIRTSATSEFSQL